MIEVHATDAHFGMQINVLIDTGAARKWYMETTDYTVLYTLDPRDLEDGWHELRVWVYDRVGHASEELVISFYSETLAIPFDAQAFDYNVIPMGIALIGIISVVGIRGLFLSRRKGATPTVDLSDDDTKMIFESVMGMEDIESGISKY